MGMMGFGELYRARDIHDFLGAEFAGLPEVFSGCQKLIDTVSVAVAGCSVGGGSA